MKKHFFLQLLITILLHTTATAQMDNVYKGPAKLDMQSFWRQADMFQKSRASETTLANMKRALDNIKQKDPTYNITLLENEYQKRKTEIDKIINSNKSEDEKIYDAKINQLAYNGVAINQIKHFWLNGLKANKLSESELNYAIREMDYAIKSTKEKDPNYNTTEMETLLKTIKDNLKAKKLAEVRQTSGDKKSSQQQESVSNDPEILLDKLFITNNISVGSTADIPQAPAKIAAYNAKLNKLLSLDYTNAIIHKGRFAKASITGSIKNTEKELNSVNEYLQSATEQTTVEYMYYNIQYQLAYWNACQKVFPEETAYNNMYQKVNSQASSIGTLQQLYAKAEANKKEKIKNTTLPNAVVHDSKLENTLIQTFNKQFASRNVTALKAVVTQNGWTTLRNTLTGVVLGRERSAKLAFKGSDGKCYLLSDYVFIKEEYIGNSFTNTKAIFNGLDGIEMLCENVK